MLSEFLVREWARSPSLTAKGEETMNYLRKCLWCGLPAVLLSSLALSVPPGPGSAHIRFSGIEVQVDGTAPEPVFDEQGNMLYMNFWSLFHQTWNAPSLSESEIHVYLDSDLHFQPAPAEGLLFHLWGTCELKMILDGEMVTVGMSSVDAYGIFVREDWVEAKLTLAGVFWDGPLSGLAVTENLTSAYPPEGPFPPHNDVVGFLIVPEYVDLQAIRKAD